MVSVCLPSDALSQHLPSYLGFSYLGPGVSLQGCSSKVQPLLLTLDEGYLLTATPSDLERGVAPLSPRAATAPWMWGCSSWLLQSCPILCKPMDCSPPCFSVHWILQARILEWFVIPFSSGPQPVRPLHHDPSVLGGPTRHGLVSLS